MPIGSPHPRQEPILSRTGGVGPAPDSSTGELSGAEPALPGQWSRDEVVAHLVFALSDYRRSLADRGRRLHTVGCSSCGDQVPGWQAPVLGGKCAECFLELFVGVILAEPALALNAAVLDEIRRELIRRGRRLPAQPQLPAEENDQYISG